jgi:hypothetical protein
MKLKTKIIWIIILIILLYAVIVYYLAWKDGVLEVKRNVNFCYGIVENMSQIPLI